MKLLGTIHKRRRHFFWIFDTPLPHVGSFLKLSVSNFDQFLTPPPLPIADVFYGQPLTWWCYKVQNWAVTYVKSNVSI